MIRTIHAGARQDVADAVDFYTHNAGAHIAARFLNEFERIARILFDNPGFGTPTTHDRRIYPLNAFPYSVIYRTKGDHLRILTVRHQSRSPGYASNRH